MVSVLSSGKLIVFFGAKRLFNSIEKFVVIQLTQRQLYVFMALLGVSRLRVSADPQVLNEQKPQNLG